MIPGYLLARLAVADSSQGRGNGGRLVVEALRTTLEAIRVGSGRVIVVDAIDDHDHNFYEHFVFSPGNRTLFADRPIFTTANSEGV